MPRTKFDVTHAAYSVPADGDIELTVVGDRSRGPHGVLVRDASALEGVPRNELIMVLQAFLAAQPKTLPQAEAAIQSTGLERFVAAGANLTSIATYLLGSAPSIASMLASLTAA